MDKKSLEQIVQAVMEELQQHVRGSGQSAPEVETRVAPDVKRNVPPDLNRNVPSGFKVAVVGAGSGGLAMAGHIALMGAEVRLFSFSLSELQPVIEAGGIELFGKVSGFAKVKVSRSLDEALAGANLIMIVAPAFAHPTYASLLAPWLEDGQVVCLNPGRTGGALEFGALLRRFALNKRIYLGEAQTFIYASELRGPGKVEILHEKSAMRAAALPATDNDHFVKTLNFMYPQITAGQNVLETSLNNVDPIVHIAPVLLNTSAIERAAKGEQLEYYRDCITPSICSLVMEKADAEKVKLAKAFGLDAWSCYHWYKASYHTEGSTLYEVLQANGAHAGKHLMHHNLLSDGVPNSCIPMHHFGSLLGVATPTIDALINLAVVMTGIDYWQHGRTPERMGLGGMTRAQILEYVESGC